MFYRAKITKILSWVECHYNLNAYSIVRDCENVYIEVKNEDEAELIESIERKQEELSRLVSEWYDKYDSLS